jgi:hypothetical protein
MKNLVMPLAAIAALAAGCAGDSTFTIENRSTFTLSEINLAPVDSLTWGEDLLGGDMLFPGETLHVDLIDCDTYDVRVEDEAGRECILVDLDLCFDDALWVISDAELASCAF